MDYQQLADKLMSHGTIDEDTYKNMVSLEDPVNRETFLLALCNSLLDKQLALGEAARVFSSKV